MAKAQFSKHQRVWVDSVGAWAVIEQIVPVWTKGFAEPVRIAYDVGFGREFTAQELRAELGAAETAGIETGWRLLRARNKWQSPNDCSHHPHPGTFPVVVTDANDWGGWRTPGAEYDRDPLKIEQQARMIAATPRLLQLARELVEAVGDSAEEAPHDVVECAERMRDLLRELTDRPPPVGSGRFQTSAPAMASAAPEWETPA